ncbi:hypothetical protein TNCV_4538901 [Trichonephila clavipes]|uniref:Uncharacterized protein n=1 Tax=Trichonephila clavipes TaxID=2585209 RepID=A0A8X7BJL1_TRICX|nr:hypothetical protein TNCV_4538901 [Trichonephila clavipes]
MQSEKDKKLYTPRRREETSGWTIDSWGDNFSVVLVRRTSSKDISENFGFLSCGEKEDEYFLTDDHVPAFRAVVQLTAEEKNSVGKRTKINFRK